MNTVLSIALGFNIGVILILIAELSKAKKEASIAWTSVASLHDELERLGHRQ